MKKKLTFTINNEEYDLISDYRDKETMRHSLNRLTKQTFGFDFEEWYQQGYWGDKYRPYSLVRRGEIVANISANPIDFLIDGKLHRTIQIGTVMTDNAYRKRGLSKVLMEFIINEYQNDCECIYLYANDSVLDFYPKFGFIEALEHNYSKSFQKKAEKYTVRKLNFHSETDKELLTRLVNNTVPVSKYSMIGNPGLVMFYLSSGYANDIYYIEELNLAAVATYDGNSLFLMDLFCGQEVDLDGVINCLINKSEMKVTLGFTPLDKSNYTEELHKVEDTTFFVKGNNLIDRGRFPVFSHA